jgi:hypothetical protein
MNLDWLDIADLRVLHNRLSVVVDACAKLERADLSPAVYISDDETTIRCKPLIDAGGDVVLVEVAAPAATESAEPARAVPAAPELAPPEPAPITTPSPSPVAKAAPAAAVELIEGPLTDFEKAEIERLVALGKTSKQIGDTLRRKSQTVGLYLNNKARAAARGAEKRNDIPAGQPAKGEPDQVNTPDATQDDVARGAGPDAEEKGIEPTARNAPVAGGASLSLPDAPEWGFAERRIVAHLNGLPRAFDWDLAGDLSMCQALARGDKLAMVALDMGKDAQWIKQRHAVVTETIRNSAGQVTVDGGAMLLRVLSTLVAGLKKGAA